MRWSLPANSATCLVAFVTLACGGSDAAASDPSSPEVTVPGAPTIGSATAGDGSASITFSAPTSNGGAVISGYTATCTAGASSRSGTGTAATIVVTGLTNGTAYGCVVTATNPVGTGPASAAVSVTPVSSGAASPNILLVIADDLGLDASPCYESVGSVKPNMPNLRALCDRGVTFESAWAYPTCTPTRASLLTGQYGIHTNVLAVGENLSSSTTTILDRLQEGINPYSVAVIGKWHVSGNNPAPNAPASYGAQYYAGFLSGAVTDYFNWTLTENGVQSGQTGYITTVLTDKAISWINGRTAPWFLWLAYNAPHTPFHAPPASLHSQAGLKNGTATDNRTKYLAALEALDTEFGRLLAAIPAATLSRTVIVFIGDNGTPAQVVQSPYTPNRAKDTPYQGGINVPMVIAGHGVSRVGQRDSALVGVVDLFATFQSLAQRSGSVPADGIDFSRALTSAGTAGRSHAYIDFRDNNLIVTAIRDSRYKLIDFGDGRRELYDLVADPFENTNLISGGTTAALDAVIAGLVAKRAELQR